MSALGRWRTFGVGKGQLYVSDASTATPLTKLPSDARSDSDMGAPLSSFLQRPDRRR